MFTAIFPSFDIIAMLFTQYAKPQARSAFGHDRELGLVMHAPYSSPLIYKPTFTLEDWNNPKNPRLDYAIRGWVNLIACTYPDIPAFMLKDSLEGKTVIPIYSRHIDVDEIDQCRHLYTDENLPSSYYDDQAVMYFDEVVSLIEDEMTNDSNIKEIQAIPKKREFKVCYRHDRDAALEDLRNAMTHCIGFGNAGDYIMLNGQGAGLITDTIKIIC